MNNNVNMLNLDQIEKLIIDTLDNSKAEDISIFYPKETITFSKLMIVATSTSKRHAKSLSEKVYQELKDNKVKILGVEGKENSEWILIDIGDIIIHIFTKETREIYDIESLWNKMKIEKDL